MKRYVAIVDGKELPFHFEKTGETTARIEIDGKVEEIDIARVGAHDYSLLLDGIAHDIDLARDGDKVKAAWQGAVLEFKLLDEKKLRRGGAAAADVAHSGDVVSPMPGKVVKVSVAVGQSVKVGDGIVVVEAMKMENEFKSPREGVVKKVNVKVGDAVEGGAILVVIE